MAFVVPFLAALGGGSAAAGAAVAVSTVASVATGVLSAQSAKNAGVAQQQQYKAEAKQEVDAARQREILRRRDLLQALSSQNAAAGAGGISTGGSISAIAKRDIQYTNEDLLVDRANTSTRNSILASAGRNAVTQGNLGAAASLLDTAVSTYQNFGGVYGKAYKTVKGIK